jgi:hypothetical protein
MEIQPATIAQVQRGRDGHFVTIDEDVLDIAKQLREIDPCLVLAWNERGGYFVIKERLENGDEKLVLTSTELDQRLVKRIEKLKSEDYNFVAELDRVAAEKQKKLDQRFHERVGDAGERLFSALHLRPKIVVPHHSKRAA